MPLTVKKHKKRKVVRLCNKKKTRKQRSKLPKTEISQLSRLWDDRKSAKKNLSAMGLSYNPNLAVLRSSKLSQKTEKEKEIVANLLQAEAKTPRIAKFKFPNAQAMYYSHLINKYGDNYKAMAKDSKNVYQDSWKRIRSKIMQFKKLEQYHEVMRT